MDNSKAFILGFGTLALGYFLAYHWSPDYFEFFSNGNNHLLIVGFAVSVLIIFNFIDWHFEKKPSYKTGTEVKHDK